MHVLGHYGKENAAAIFELFLECMPEYPLDKPDNEGNTGTSTLDYFLFFGYQLHICDEINDTDVFICSIAPGLYERER